MAEREFVRILIQNDPLSKFCNAFFMDFVDFLG